MARPPQPVPASAEPLLQEALVEQCKPLGGRSYWLSLALPAPAPPALPGQFYMLRRDQGWPVLLARPFSLAWQAPSGRALGFLVEELGKGSRALAALSPGAGVTLWGPLGNGFPCLEGALLVAGGVGLAPFLVYLEHAQAPLLFGGRNAEALATALLAPPGSSCRLATDDGSVGFHGTVVDLAAALIADGTLPPGPLLACGPWPMLAATARLAAGLGLPCLVSVETHMGCGVGICTGCALRVRPEAAHFGGKEMVLACRQGPVFDAADLVWEA